MANKTKAELVADLCDDIRKRRELYKYHIRALSSTVKDSPIYRWPDEKLNSYPKPFVDFVKARLVLEGPTMVQRGVLMPPDLNQWNKIKNEYPDDWELPVLDEDLGPAVDILLYGDNRRENLNLYTALVNGFMRKGMKFSENWNRSPEAEALLNDISYDKLASCQIMPEQRINLIDDFFCRVDFAMPARSTDIRLIYGFYTEQLNSYYATRKLNCPKLAFDKKAYTERYNSRNQKVLLFNVDFANQLYDPGSVFNLYSVLLDDLMSRKDSNGDIVFSKTRKIIILVTNTYEFYGTGHGMVSDEIRRMFELQPSAKNFKQKLDDICRKYSINRGNGCKVEVWDFNTGWAVIDCLYRPSLTAIDRLMEFMIKAIPDMSDHKTKIKHICEEMKKAPRSYPSLYQLTHVESDLTYLETMYKVMPAFVSDFLAQGSRLTPDDLFANGVVTQAEYDFYLRKMACKVQDNIDMSEHLPSGTDLHIIGNRDSGKKELARAVMEAIFKRQVKLYKKYNAIPDAENFISDIRYDSGIETQKELYPHCNHHLAFVSFDVPGIGNRLNLIFSKYNESQTIKGLTEELPADFQGLPENGDFPTKVFKNGFDNGNKKIIVITINSYDLFARLRGRANADLLSSMIDRLENLAENRKRNMFARCKALYVVVTKTDAIDRPGNADFNLLDAINSELKSHPGYSSLMEKLETICKKYKINSGSGFKPQLLPVTVGKQLPGCMFRPDPIDADNLAVNVLRSASSGLFSKLFG